MLSVSYHLIFCYLLGMFQRGTNRIVEQNYLPTQAELKATTIKTTILSNYLFNCMYIYNLKYAANKSFTFR